MHQPRQASPVLTGVEGVIHQVLMEINETKRSPLSPTFRCSDRRYLLADKLRTNIQHWLSPPNPSANHNSVSDARYSGTGTWFFESEALKEWNSRGSLLWIHGIRMFYKPLMSALH